MEETSIKEKRPVFIIGQVHCTHFIILRTVKNDDLKGTLKKKLFISDEKTTTSKVSDNVLVTANIPNKLTCETLAEINNLPMTPETKKNNDHMIQKMTLEEFTIHKGRQISYTLNAIIDKFSPVNLLIPKKKAKTTITNKQTIDIVTQSTQEKIGLAKSFLIGGARRHEAHCCATAKIPPQQY